jgi:glutathione S-transferase
MFPLNLEGARSMITVWGRRSSVNVQKVLWALGEAGVEFDRVTVGGSFGGLDTPEYKKINPMQVVPAIKDGTITMAESHAILRYLSRRYGKGTLQPRGFRAWRWPSSGSSGPPAPSRRRSGRYS